MEYKFTDSKGQKYQLFSRSEDKDLKVHLEYGLIRNMNLEEVFNTHRVPEEVKSSCQLIPASKMAVEGIYTDDEKEGEVFPIGEDDLVLVSSAEQADSFIPGSKVLREDVILLRKDPRSEAIAIGLAVVLLAGGVRSTLHFTSAIQWISILGLVEIPIPLFFLPALILIAYILHSIFDSRYYIEKNCIRAEHGLASLNSRETRIDFVHLRGTEVHQSLTDRIFDVGTLKIGSAMQANAEVVLDGILHPEKWERRVVELARKANNNTEESSE